MTLPVGSGRENVKKVDFSHDEIRKRVGEFAQTLPRPSPAGCCLIVSDALIELFFEAGHTRSSVQFGKLNGRMHCWAEVWNQQEGTLVVDLTADQFGANFPPVVIGDRDAIFAEYPYAYDETGD